MPQLTTENGTADNNESSGISDAGGDLCDYVYFSINMVGFVLNVLVILVATLRPFIQSKITRILLVNQCLTDSIGALLSALEWISFDSLRVPANLIGDVVCHLWWSTFFEWSFIQASINGMILFTVERYLSIVRPLTHQRFTTRRLYVLIAFSWIFALVSNVVVLFEGERDGNECQAGYIEPTLYAVEGFFVLFLYLTPLTVVVVLYSHMILFLKKQKRLHAARQSHRRIDASRDLTITLAIAATAYTCLFGPQTFVYYLFTTGAAQIDIGGWLMLLCNVLVNVNFIVNPLVFLLLPSFRRELRRLLRRSTSVEPVTSLSPVDTTHHIAVSVV